MHYNALVILPKNFEPSSVEKVVSELERLINPYKEGNIPDGLMDICECVMMKAESKATKRITELCENFRRTLLSELGLLDDELQTSDKKKNTFKNIQLEIVEKAHNAIMSGMNVLAAGLAQKYIPYEKPDPECRVCNGRGERPAFFNPNRKFDMFNLASEHIVSLYHVYLLDKDNVFNDESVHKWLKRNMQKVSGFKDNYRWQAVITPDGWHDRDDHEDEDRFEDHLKKLLKQHEDCYVLVCDMHH